MKILLLGSTGGIGSAIKESLQENEFVDNIGDIDWIIFAQGIIDEGKVEKTFAVNVLSSIKITEECLSRLTGGVIYISSTSGIKGNTKFPVYSASKAALNSYTQTMARKHPELQFYAICPGPTNTKMWRSLNLEGTPQEPIEVAKVVKDCMGGKFKSGDIITVRNGIVSV